MSTLSDLGQARQRDVGKAEIVGENGAGDVDPVESALLDHHRRHRVENSGELQELAGGERRAERAAALRRCGGGVKHRTPCSGRRAIVHAASARMYYLQPSSGYL